MLFSSITFLYYFLPLSLLLYFITPKNFKNTALLLLSFVFYSWGEPKYVILMAVSIILGYVFGILIERFRGTRLSKIFMIISVSLSLSSLLFFKYTGFFLDNLANLTGNPKFLFRITLPLGISFYTFQIISYTADVYSNNAKAQKNIINLAAYISLFPQLIAGPIVRYTDIESQLKVRCHTIEKTAFGIKIFTIGLLKKIVIANALGEFCSIYHSSEEKSVLLCWSYAVSYSLQVYFDFSGYSDMAIGLGKIFGFDFCRNFNYPYISKSITEFWRRWHISLGSWFRDYVYIPLGGNRTSKLKHLRNILIVWLLTGLWHGAAWNFIIWGLYFAVFLIVEKFLLRGFLTKHAALSHIYVIFTVLISFVIFSFENINDTFDCIMGMFRLSGYPLVTKEHLYYTKSFGFIIILAAIGATPLLSTAYRKIKDTRFGSRVLILAEPLCLVFIVILCTSYLVNGSFNPFLYFRF